MNKPSTDSVFLELSHVTYSYTDDSKKIIEKYSLSISKGKITVLVGPNGSGKTTILKILAGLIPQFSGGVFTGQCRLEGKMYDSIDPLTFGVVLQNQNEPFVHDELEKEIVSILEAAGNDSGEIKSKYKTLVNIFDLDRFTTRKLESLSSGEKQWVKIVLAFVLNPSVMLMDEPFIHLDADQKQKMVTILKKVQIERHLTYVIADQTDKTWTFLNPEVQQLGQSYEPVVLIPQPRVNHKTDPLISIKNVSFSYTNVSLIKNLNFIVQRAQCIGVVGPNGSGKTTLLDMIMEHIQPTSGSFSFHQDIRSRACFVQPFINNFFSLKVGQEMELQKTISDINISHDRYIYDLSDGERALITNWIAKASDADIILMDEPFAHADSKTTMVISQNIQHMITNGKTVIFTTHDGGIADQTANQMIKLSK